MEAIGLGLQAIGNAIGTWGSAFGWIYVIGILCKTLLIGFLVSTSEEIVIEDITKDWFNFNFWNKKNGKL